MKLGICKQCYKNTCDYSETVHCDKCRDEYKKSWETFTGKLVEAINERENELETNIKWLLREIPNMFKADRLKAQRELAYNRKMLALERMKYEHKI